MRWPASRILLALFVVVSIIGGQPTPPVAQAQACAIIAPSGYTQDFNTLAATGTSSALPVGWFFAEAGTNANTTYTAGTGSSNAGDTYSFGAAGSSERALGGLRSGSLTPTFGACFTNGTGAVLTALTVTYTGEQWRAGSDAALTDRLDVAYSLNAGSLTDPAAVWSDVDALDFASPIAGSANTALDGNAAANRAARSATIGGLSIPSNGTIWIRWTDLDIVGSDDGLAVDDFSAAAGTPPQGDQAPSVASTVPTGGATGVPVASSITVTFSEPVTAPAAAFALACAGAPQPFTLAPPTGTATAFTLDPTADLPSAATCTVTVTGSLVADADAADPPDTMAADFQFSFDTAVVQQPGPLRIHDIQGAAHTSPRNGQAVVNVPGIVTAKRANGYHLQDPSPDADDATSEAIVVFTSSPPTVNVGDAVLVSGTVTEFRPGGAGSNNLSLTEIVSPTTSLVSSGNPLPAPVVLGAGGRPIPNQIINNDAAGNVETGGAFDPVEDGIDFFESLEGMLVQVNNAVVVGPTNDFGEIWVLADNGANASGRTARGGSLIVPTDFNPERIQIDDTIVSGPPAVNVGDRFSGPIVGVVDYNFGNFEVLNTQALPAVAAGGLTREVTAVVAAPNKLTVGNFNVENLDPGDGAPKFAALADRVVANLRSPDILILEEVQDNNGPTNDGIVDANVTLQTLIAAIGAAGGPTYEFRQINPVDDQDGGEPGGNIRVAFLFNPARVQFVDRPGGTPTGGTAVTGTPGAPQLSASPGRIDPTNTAFNASRKPLAGEFRFNGRTVFVIANHFNSKGGDQPLFGRFQPPTLTTEFQRLQQATVVKTFVQGILALDPNARIVLGGDFNDFEFSAALVTLKSAPLSTLVETLPANERYTYVFEGNSQTLDHILVSPALLAALDGFDVVHINAEFADQISDHDPSVARFTILGDTTPPTTTAATTPTAPNGQNGWFTGTVGVALTATDDAGGLGVKEVVYSTTGAQTTASTVTPGATASLSIAAEGTTTITYFARDNAGNQEAPKTLVVKVDTQNPSVSCSASPSSIWPPNNKLVPVTLTVTVTDAGSGPGGFVLTNLTVAEGTVQANTEGWTLGTADVQGQVRADRAGNGTGQVYTFTYTGADQAGRTATCTEQVTVPHDQGGGKGR